MKTYFLARIAGQPFAIEKEAVVGVAIRDIEKTKPIVEHNRHFLPLTDERRGLICDLQSMLMSRITSKTRLSHYLVVTWLGTFFAIPMNDKGCLVSAEEESCRQLPPLFTGLSRKIVPRTLVNGNEILTFIDLETLTHVFHDASLQTVMAA